MAMVSAGVSGEGARSAANRTTEPPLEAEPHELSIQQAAGSGPRRLAIALTVAVVGAHYAAVADLPFLSEDYTVLAAAASMDVGACFELSRPPLRPLHDLFFLALQRGDLAPWLARVPGYFMYVLCAALVWRLAAMLGAAPRRQLAALALFLAYPAAVSLSWVAAVSTLGRTTFLLLALCALLTHLRQPRATTGATAVASFVLALAWHQAALAFAAWALALPACDRSLRRRAWTDPWVWSIALVAIGYAALLAMLSPSERHHGVKQLGAILANVPRAALAFAPEQARWIAIDGLRGKLDLFGVAFAVALLGATLWAAAWVWRHTQTLARALLICVGCDFILPVLVTGFVMRYAGLGSALVAVVLATCARTRVAIGAISLLGLTWALAHARELRDVRTAGATVDAIVHATDVARQAAGPDALLHIIDPPGFIGRERDVPVFNWGLTQALRRSGLGERYWVVRTVDYVTSSDIEKVTPAAAAALTPSVDWHGLRAVRE